MDGYTKQELAEICGVSAQAIDKKLRKTGLIEQCSKVANRLQIPATVATNLATSYRVTLQPQQPKVAAVAEKQQPTATAATNSATKNETIGALVRELEVLHKQLEVKDEQIASLGRALEAAQETAKAAQLLHAADRKDDLALESTEQKKSRWQRLKEAWTE